MYSLYSIVDYYFTSGVLGDNIPFVHKALLIILSDCNAQSITEMQDYWGEPERYCIVHMRVYTCLRPYTVNFK